MSLVARLSLAACLAALLPACTQSPGTRSAKRSASSSSQTQAGGGRLALDMPTLPGVDPTSATFSVIVQPANVTQSAPYAAGSQFVVNNLPPGQQTIQVEVLDASNNILWQGSTPVTVTAGTQTAATVTLAPAAATVAAGTGSVQVSLIVGQPAAPGIDWGDGTTGAQTAAVASTTPTVVIDVTMTPEGTHTVGGVACPAGYQQIGAFADCGGGTCNGDQTVCVETAPLASLAQAATMVQAISVSSEAHVAGGTPCAAGWVEIGAVADCSGGTCNGDQVLCKQVVAVSSVPAGTFVPQGLSMTPEATHQPGGVACPSGATTIGPVEDCGGGSCSGDQTLCELP